MELSFVKNNRFDSIFDCFICYIIIFLFVDLYFQIIFLNLM